MIKKLLSLVIIVFIIPAVPTMASTPPPSSELNQHDIALLEQGKQARQHVERLTKQIGENKAGVTIVTHRQLQNALATLKVKETLVQNFRGTSSLQNATVRDRLLSVLRQDNISTEDLARLQALVAQHKK